MNLTRDVISVDHVQRLVAGGERGGTCVFLGTVRDEGGPDGVTAIEYSAYEPMANAELDRIVAEARTRWPEADVAVRHRLGRIAVGEASIVIAAAAPHRAEAFAACRYVIEEVKQRLPVWKKEYKRDGTAVWVNHQGQPA
jgi:molybdopterin synthase catalytic subunit